MSTTETPVDELKGESLEAELERLGLPKSGSAAEKRERIADARKADANTADNGQLEPSQSPSGSDLSEAGTDPETRPDEEDAALRGAPAEGEATAPADQNVGNQGLGEGHDDDEDDEQEGGGDPSHDPAADGEQRKQLDALAEQLNETRMDGADADLIDRALALAPIYALAVLRRRCEIRGLGPADFERVWSELGLPDWPHMSERLGTL